MRLRSQVRATEQSQDGWKTRGKSEWARSRITKSLTKRVTVWFLWDESHPGPRMLWTSKAPVVRIHWGRADELSVVSVPYWELRWRSDSWLFKRFHPKTTMIATFFPLKKLRRNTRYLLFLAILLAGLAAVYHEMVASKAWNSDTSKLELLIQQVFGHLNFFFQKSCITWSGQLKRTLFANSAIDK